MVFKKFNKNIKSAWACLQLLTPNKNRRTPWKGMPSMWKWELWAGQSRGASSLLVTSFIMSSGQRAVKPFRGRSGWCEWVVGVAAPTGDWAGVQKECGWGSCGWTKVRARGRGVKVCARPNRADEKFRWRSVVGDPLECSGSHRGLHLAGERVCRLGNYNLCNWATELV